MSTADTEAGSSGRAAGEPSAGPAIVLGDLNADLVIRVPGDVVDVNDAMPTLYGGGTAGNVAAGLSRLGVPVGIVASVGDDAFGRRLVEELSDDGADTAGVRFLGDGFTPLVIALIQPDGDRVTLVWPPERGADVLLTPEDLDEDQVASAGWLHTSGMSLRHEPVRDAALTAMELARQADVPVSLDLNLRAELWGMDDAAREVVHRAVALADVVLGSGPEEIALLGRRAEPAALGGGTGRGAVEHAAAALCEGRRTVVARLGAAGALAVTPTGTHRSPAFPTTVVDTVGAGDAFDAGFICASLRGLCLADALRWGNAVAALSVGGRSARALPSREEVERLLAA